MANISLRKVFDEGKSDILSVVEKEKIVVPKGFIPENALMSAYLKLTEMKSDVEQCSSESVNRALLKMVVQGLDPEKNQCYFVKKSNSLVCMRSYLGSERVAKVFCGVQDIRKVVVYKNDTIKTNLKNGSYSIEEHVQDPFNNSGEIIGAYAIAIYPNGKTFTEIMTISDIQQAWKQGALYKGEGGQTVHAKFPTEMVKKTVVQRLCKHLINSATDTQVNDMAEDYEDESDRQMREAENIETPKIETTPLEIIEDEAPGPQKNNEEIENAEVVPMVVEDAPF